MDINYINSARKEFSYYKMLAEKTINQVPDDKLFWQFNEESNSIAMIMKHMSGNMLSRWTDFLTSDGEKPWRERDKEFAPSLSDKNAVLEEWEQAWNCVFHAIDSLNPADLEKIVYIRNQGHTVVEAINRQLAHYPYHVGQIVFIGKMIRGNDWVSLSIPRNKSSDYNQQQFSAPKQRKHFTDGRLPDSEASKP